MRFRIIAAGIILKAIWLQRKQIPKRERKEKSVEEKTDTKILSYNLFKEGKSLLKLPEKGISQ